MKALKTIVATAVVVFALTTVAAAGVRHFTDPTGQATAETPQKVDHTVTLTDRQLAKLLATVRREATHARRVQKHHAQERHAQKHHVEKQGARQTRRAATTKGTCAAGRCRTTPAAHQHAQRHEGDHATRSRAGSHHGEHQGEHQGEHHGGGGRD